MRRSGVGVCIAVVCVALLAYITAGPRHAERNRTVPVSSTATWLRSGTTRPAASNAGSQSSVRTAAVLQGLKGLPLSFEPNVGQSDSEAKYLARGAGYVTFLTARKAVLELRAPTMKAKKPTQPASALKAKSVEVTALSMELEGANSTTRLVAEDKLPGVSNYLIGRNASDWRTDIPNYRRVREKSVYPGIDLVYYGTQRQLEYDFVVAPGAQPQRIRLKIDGARKLRIDAAGTLEATLTGGVVEFHKPVAYQEAAGKRRAVEAAYLMNGEHVVSLRVGKYDRSLPLVIDPVLAYSTYLGGSGIDVANGIAVAPDDTAFVAGGTLSSNYPVKNAFQGTAPGPEDAFVTKLSADGSTLVYSTYLGGGGVDVANGIAVDNLADAYVTGQTTSPDFPVDGNAIFPNCGADTHCGSTWNDQNAIVTNGFVTKLNVTGTAPIYSTYIGLYQETDSQAIAVDANGIAYITGQIGANLPVTTRTPPAFCPGLFPIVHGFEPGYPGGVGATNDGCAYTAGGSAATGFVMAISANGSGILYSTYLGGTTQDDGLGIAADDTGNAYVAGLSYSPDFPLLNGVDTVYGGLGDGFFTKINTTAVGAASLLYSTYLGGGALDQANAVAIDPSNYAYVAGVTASANLPFATLNGYSGKSDAFIAKLNPGASGAGSLVYFRYLGGSLADSANGIAVDSGGNAYVTGSTSSPDFPIVAGAFQTAYGGGNADAFVTKIDPSGVNLVYSSFLGGTNTDVGNGIAIDAAGSAFVAGETCSLDFPLAHPLQANSGGNCDAFASKVEILSGVELNPAGLVFPAQSLGTTSAAQTVSLTNGDNPVTINGIAIVGTNADEFAETNTCPATLSPGGVCTITVTFTPTASGLAKAAMEITDSAPGSPQVVSLSGSTSTLTLSTSNINFGNEQVGQSAEPQTIIATNQGNVPITISGITASGAFTETDDCTKAPLQPTTNCSITVTFTPQVAGQSVGALEISDNAPGSPQEVLLYGTGIGLTADFTLAVQPSSATISAGQTAQVTLAMTSTGGFKDAVTLSCSGLPAQSTCEFAANPVSVGASTSVPLAITTVARTTAPPAGPSAPLAPPSRLLPILGVWLGVLMMLLLVSAAIPAIRARRRAVGVFALAVTMALFSAACNGGTQNGVPSGTPAGTYQVTVTGTSGAISHAATVSLQVK